jgi:hypothetical protein
MRGPLGGQHMSWTSMSKSKQAGLKRALLRVVYLAAPRRRHVAHVEVKEVGLLQHKAVGVWGRSATSFIKSTASSVHNLTGCFLTKALWWFRCSGSSRPNRSPCRPGSRSNCTAEETRARGCRELDSRNTGHMSLRSEACLSPSMSTQKGCAKPSVLKRVSFVS